MKKYTIELDCDFEMNIGISQDEDTKKRLQEINDFWSGSEDRLLNFSGDIYKTVCSLIAKEVVRLQSITSFNSTKESIIEVFNEGIEGFYPLDGSEGIEILEINIPFSPWDLTFDITEVANK